MAKFDQDTLRRPARCRRKIAIRTEKRGDEPVTIWVVAPGDDVFVALGTRPQGPLVQGPRQGGDATVEFDGRRLPVRATPAHDAASLERASDEYLRKYRTSPYAKAMVKPETLPTTLRLEPR